MRDISILRDDPVTFEVVRGGLYAICEEMKSVMMRASFSPLLSLSADLSCAILDHAGDVVAQGVTSLPVFVGSMQSTTRAVIDGALIRRDGPKANCLRRHLGDGRQG